MIMVIDVPTVIMTIVTLQQIHADMENPSWIECRPFPLGKTTWVLHVGQFAGGYTKFPLAPHLVLDDPIPIIFLSLDSSRLWLPSMVLEVPRTMITICIYAYGATYCSIQFLGYPNAMTYDSYLVVIQVILPWCLGFFPCWDGKSTKSRWAFALRHQRFFRTAKGSLGR